MARRGVAASCCRRSTTCARSVAAHWSTRIGRAAMRPTARQGCAWPMVSKFALQARLAQLST
eukprot:7820861-Pyramimonas_sp.AAC.1